MTQLQAFGFEGFQPESVELYNFITNEAGLYRARCKVQRLPDAPNALLSERLRFYHVQEIVRDGATRYQHDAGRGAGEQFTCEQMLEAALLLYRLDKADKLGDI